MGRMACESGKKVTWDEALASNIELAPGLDNYTWDSNPPAMRMRMASTLSPCRPDAQACKL